MDNETEATTSPNAIPVICDRCRAEGAAGSPDFSGIPDILGFDPVPRRAHAEGWTPEYQRAFIAALAITGSARRAGRAIGKHAFGAEQLRKARGGRSFSDAWDAALDIARERELARLRENLSGLAREQAERELPYAPEGGVMPMEGEAEEDEHEAARERIRDHLLRARRLYLLLIHQDPDKRAAWEELAGPVDWDKAAALKPQDNEPYGTLSMRKPDMLLCADAGIIPEATPGHDTLSQIVLMIDTFREEQGLPPLRNLDPEGGGTV